MDHVIWSHAFQGLVGGQDPCVVDEEIQTFFTSSDSFTDTVYKAGFKGIIVCHLQRKKFEPVWMTLNKGLEVLCLVGVPTGGDEYLWRCGVTQKLLD